ncbi:MAG: hypothetical protein FD166_2315 [Bacteroidetes bacterium]|nr:MAG: hypothetical protein FD166_2315 [Bacteroidota bacterium]
MVNKYKENFKEKPELVFILLPDPEPEPDPVFSHLPRYRQGAKSGRKTKLLQKKENQCGSLSVGVAGLEPTPAVGSLPR